MTAEQEELRNRFVCAARGMVGTPWHHQGRAPGAGLDCVGLLICAGKQAGLVWEEGLANYPRRMDIRTVVDALMRNDCVRVPNRSFRAGDIVLLTVEGVMAHAGLVSKAHPETLTYIHVPAIGNRKCIEEPLTAEMQRTVFDLWRPKAFWMT